MEVVCEEVTRMKCVKFQVGVVSDELVKHCLSGSIV